MPPSSTLRSCSQLFLDRTAHSSIACRRLLLDAPQTACFSTSSARYANPPVKKKGMVAAPKRGTKTLNVKKGRKSGASDMGKRPGVGERKALRKRVVLSNDNAVEVSSLKDVDKNNVLTDQIEGKVMGIPELTVDALRAVEAFKPSQGWSLFRRPAVLMRKEAIELGKLIKEVESADEGGAKQTVRRILTGSRMSGKSTLLLQGLMMAHVREWVIINLPDGMSSLSAFKIPC
jgi:small subunit ribosomal protein S29